MERRLTAIKAITDFIFVKDLPVEADLIIVPGSSHPQLPKKAVSLYKKRFASRILFTGGFNQKINQKESNFGKKIALRLNVPLKDIICEDQSSNTKENASKAARLVKRHHLICKKILLVCKPYHARRLEMTFSKFFPKSRLFLIPAKDERDITRRNWWRDEEKITKVMEEVGKISEYFQKGDLSL